jgi:transcription initiation factor TFIID subunit 11
MWRRRRRILRMLCTTRTGLIGRWLLTVCRLLVDAFNPMQSARYDLFKRTKLRKESLRRIVNHALSQSVPAGVVTTVNGFTKVFVGEIVEKARTVQAEWAEAHDQAALAAFEAEEQQAQAQTQESASVKQEESSADDAPSARPPRQFNPPPNPHRGQLLPAHLREAQRRHRRDCESGGVGFAGLSMDNLGSKGSFVWNTGSAGGRRIFR